jgi:hypothetical protein
MCVTVRKIASNASQIYKFCSLIMDESDRDMFGNNLAMGFACPVGDLIPYPRDVCHSNIRWERVMGNVTSRAVAESGRCECDIGTFLP